MKDSKNVMDLKKQAISGSKSSGGGSKSKEGGYKTYHILFMAVLGLALGAHIQMTYLNAPAGIAAEVPKAEL